MNEKKCRKKNGKRKNQLINWTSTRTINCLSESGDDLDAFFVRICHWQIDWAFFVFLIKFFCIFKLLMDQRKLKWEKTFNNLPEKLFKRKSIKLLQIAIGLDIKYFKQKQLNYIIFAKIIMMKLYFSFSNFCKQNFV